MCRTERGVHSISNRPFRHLHKRANTERHGLGWCEGSRVMRRVQVAAATWLTWLMSETSALHVFTCRHTFEPALLAELARAGYSDCSSPCAGAVLVQHDDQHDEAPDLTYALQALPCSHEVRGGSIKSLASAAAEILDVEILRSLPRSLVTTLCPTARVAEESCCYAVVRRLLKCWSMACASGTSCSSEDDRGEWKWRWRRRRRRRWRWRCG